MEISTQTTTEQRVDVSSARLLDFLETAYQYTHSAMEEAMKNDQDGKVWTELYFLQERLDSVIKSKRRQKSNDKAHRRESDERSVQRVDGRV